MPVIFPFKTSKKRTFCVIFLVFLKLIIFLLSLSLSVNGPRELHAIYMSSSNQGWYFSTTHVHWWIKEMVLGVHPPPSPIFFIIMQFLAKKCQITHLRLSPSWG